MLENESDVSLCRLETAMRGGEKCVAALVRAHDDGGLRDELIELGGVDAAVDALDDLLRHEGGVDLVRQRRLARAQRLEALRDLVERDALALAIALDDEHGSLVLSK